MKSEKRQCEARVYDSRGVYDWQCQKPAVVQRNSKWYCKIHDPEHIKQKDEERQRKWDAGWAERKKQQHRQAVIQSLTNNLPTETLEKHLATIREFIQGLEV